MGLPYISERKYIRWLPNDPSEPTSTLVLTSAESRFVDIRVSKGPDSGAFNSLEWAFAGTSSSQPAHEENGQTVPAHSTWTHLVDSRVPYGDPPTDEGDMYPQPDGTVLEKGQMAHPDTGIITEYEELWHDPEVEKVGEEAARTSVVLTTDDPGRSARGMVVRLGQWGQGVLQVGNDFTAERWRYSSDPHDEPAAWKLVFKIGTSDVPIPLTFQSSDILAGHTLLYGDLSWKVDEKFEW